MFGCNSIGLIPTSWIFDKSEEFEGTGTIFEVSHTFTRIGVSISRTFVTGILSYRRHRGANALHIAHFRPFKAPYRQLRPLHTDRNLEECHIHVERLTGDKVRSLEVHKYVGWERFEPGSPWCQSNAWTATQSRAL